MKEKQTLSEALRELHDAWDDFALKVAYALGIDRVCRWLTRVVERCRRR